MMGHGAFGRAIKAWADNSIDRMETCSNEQRVRQYLVLPLLQALGYDPSNPQQVVPEAAAGNAQKPHGRVDYCLVVDGDFAVAIETKAISKTLCDEQAQLKRYFEAIPTVKVGILTNGVIFRFFTSTDHNHLMDAEPFASIDIKEIATKGPSDFQVHLLQSLSRDQFDMQAITEVADTRLLEERLKRWWLNQMHQPDDEMCKFALRAQGKKYINQRTIENLRTLVMSAFLSAVSNIVWDIFRKRGVLGFAQPPGPEQTDPRIVTTAREIEVYNQAKLKLAHLGNAAGLSHQLLDHVKYRDYVGHFTVYYGSVRKGSLFKFYEAEERQGANEKFIFDGGREYNSIDEIDGDLLNTYRRRINEVGAPSS
jgi:hypothetical protein